MGCIELGEILERPIVYLCRPIARCSTHIEFNFRFGYRERTISLSVLIIVITIRVLAAMDGIQATAKDMMKSIAVHLWTFADDVNSTRFTEVNFTIDMNLLCFVTFQKNVTDECAMS